MAANLRKWTAEECDRALLVLAACGGNASRASAILKQAGITISARTLHKWRTIQHPDRYVELASQKRREIEAIAETRMREAMLQALSVQEQALEAQSEQLSKGEARDPSAVARNAGVVFGIAAEKNLLFSGRPTAIQQTDSVETILERLRAKHPAMFIEGEAEEIRPTEADQRFVRELERRRDPD